MTRKNWLWGVVALGVLCGAPVVAEAQDAPLVVKSYKKRKAGTWFRADSAHFTVYSDAPQAEVARLLTRLEKFRYLLRSYVRLAEGEGDAEPRLELTYFAGQGGLDTVAPESPEYTIGVYKSCEEGVQGFGVHMFYDAADHLALEKRPENEGLSYIFEAYARHFFYRHSYERTPTWFIDGFAHYFSTARFEGDLAIVGQAPEAIATHLHRLRGHMRYSVDYKDLLNQNETGSDKYIGAAGVKLEYQSRAWIFTHYILSSQENRKKFSLYLANLQKGDAPEKAFEQAFGFKVSKLSWELKMYMSSKLQAARLTFKALPVADAVFETLPEGAENLVVPRAMMKGCAGARKGPGLLDDVRRAAAAYPNDARAKLTLARAEMLWGDPHAALGAVDGLTKDTANAAEAHYLTGRARLRLGQLPAAADAFFASADIAPDAPETSYYLGKALLAKVGAPDPDGLGALVRAWQLAPEVDAYALDAGLAYAYLGDGETAVKVLRTVADNPRGRSLAGVAEGAMKDVRSGAGRDAALALLRSHPLPDDGGLPEWTIASAAVWQALWVAVKRDEVAVEMQEMAPDTDQPPPLTYK